jgi:hypothetical protein
MTMNSHKQPERRQSQLRAYLLAVFAMTILLALPDGVSAQSQWTTNGSNINNTNTGNVGIGTNSPIDLLEIYRSQNGGTLIRIDNPDSTSPYAYTGVAFYQNGVRRSQLVSVNDGCATCIGGAGAMQLYNFANTNMVFATNSLERMRITNTGNIGIGTTSPQTKFHLGQDQGEAFRITNTNATDAVSISTYSSSGTALQLGVNQYMNASGYDQRHNTANPSWSLFMSNRSTQDLFSIYRTNSSGSLATLFQINGNGNVGIGTVSPGYRLDVQGGQLNASGGFCIAGDCKTSWSQVGGSQWTTSGSNIYYNSGNVGIGTSSPGYRLHISGNNTVGGGYPVIKLQNTQAGGHSHWLYSGANGAAGDFGFYDETDNAYRFYVKGTSGNFGIGTTSPSDKLDVAGSIRMSSGYFFSSVGGNLKLNADSANDIEFYQNGGLKAGIYDGNLGIGTTTPGNLLQLNSGVTPASGQFRISANNAGSLSGIAYSPNNIALGFDVDYTNGSWIARDASVAWLYKTTSKFLIQGSAGNSVGGAAALNSYMAIDLSNGNVGIGTTSPTAKLHVVGDITVTGNINAKYQDVAEWVPALHNLPAGTVVVLNPTQSNQVMASAQSYDTRVAGVVSEKPGLTLGEAGADKVLVATTGRVKVKVDATRAAIRVGDLLVTSDQEGVAMKSEPLSLGGTPIHRPGTLIGKALEPLEKGRGEILVLLSLQ